MDSWTISSFIFNPALILLIDSTLCPMTCQVKLRTQLNHQKRAVALKNLVSYVMRTHVFHVIAPEKQTLKLFEGPFW